MKILIFLLMWDKLCLEKKIRKSYENLIQILALPWTISLASGNSLCVSFTSCFQKVNGSNILSWGKKDWKAHLTLYTMRNFNNLHHHGCVAHFPAVSGAHILSHVTYSASFISVSNCLSTFSFSWKNLIIFHKQLQFFITEKVKRPFSLLKKR